MTSPTDDSVHPFSGDDSSNSGPQAEHHSPVTSSQDDSSTVTENTTSAEPKKAQQDHSDSSEKEVEPGTVSAISEDVLPSVLRQALEKKGYEKLTAVQTAVIESDTDATDLRISSQTGSGKTVAIGLALGRELLKSGPRRAREQVEGFDPRAPEVLLLTPTRELAGQVARELAWLFSELPDAWVEVVTGGTSVGLERKHLAKGPRIVVATPGRALDHLKNNGFSGLEVAHVVLDEADQMLDMGFRDELQGILDELPNRRRTHLVSATFSGEVLRIAERYQQQAIRIEGTALGAANEDIEHIAHVVSFRHRYDALVNLLLKQKAENGEDDSARTLIFARTRADTLEVAERLQRDGMTAEPLSGDLAQAQRTRTLGAFRSGRVTTLVATDVAARGIDVQGVDLVVHLEPPGDPDSFTHRSGRTGRAGRKGTSVLLLPPQARGRVERMLRVAGVKPNWAPVPTADKIRKLYSKLGRRKLYAALDLPVEEEKLEYAKKLMTEHSAEEVIARLLGYVDVTPPCPPRDISEHFAAESRGQGGGSRGRPGGRYDNRRGGGGGFDRRDGFEGRGPRRGPDGGGYGGGGPRGGAPRGGGYQGGGGGGYQGGGGGYQEGGGQGSYQGGGGQGGGYQGGGGGGYQGGGGGGYQGGGESRGPGGNKFRGPRADSGDRRPGGGPSAPRGPAGRSGGPPRGGGKKFR